MMASVMQVGRIDDRVAVPVVFVDSGNDLLHLEGWSWPGEDDSAAEWADRFARFSPILGGGAAARCQTQRRFDLAKHRGTADDRCRHVFVFVVVGVLARHLSDEVREFVALARSGAYVGGDRRVSPSERTRWRFTFQRLVTDAHGALQAEDVGTASIAVEELVDLACATREYDYFRSEDPVEAARFVVSDSVALLWGKLRDQYGFAGFAERAAPQLIRWESRYGWTRSGWDRVSQQETSLATVLARMLSVTDMWIGFCDCYLDALDQVARDDAAKPAGARDPPAGSLRTGPRTSPNGISCSSTGSSIPRPRIASIG